MGVNPHDFEVSEELLRRRLGLSSDTVVISYGYEGMKDESSLYVLKTKFDASSLFVRTRPDYFVIESTRQYFVEAKQRTVNVEAIQLLYNKFYERIGLQVYYSFPELIINASQIPMETVIIPENYKEKFDSEIKHLFLDEGVTDFQYVGHVSKGSGDAFVPIELEDLNLLSEMMTH